MTKLLDAYEAQLAAGGIADDPAQRDAVAHLDALGAALAARPKRKRLFGRKTDAPGGVYLWGGVGRGKSMLMDLFVASLNGNAKRRVHFHEFMQEVHAGMNRARRQGLPDALAPVADALVDELSLLALDEMQINDIADAMIVGRLFERLLEGGVAVVTTSNRPPDGLYENGLNRKLFEPFIALINERLNVFELCAAEDYRQTRIAGDPVFFTPADDDAKNAIDHIWTALTGGNETTLDLTIQGRVLHLERYHNGTARVGFAELCGRPLGAADYLALAGTLRVLILEDIPGLSPANFDAARRFVTLIDTLYEARVHLIASAAAGPDELYTAGTGSFEFERTASRLREMQGQDWGPN